MVGVEIHIRLEKEKRYEFLQAVRFCSLKCKEISACIEQMLYENVFEEGRFMWVEHWDNAESLKSHLQSDPFRALLGAVDVLGHMEIGLLTELEQLPANMNKIS